MLRGFFFFMLMLSANTVQQFATLPDGDVARCAQADAAGNLYVAGTSAKNTFVAKLSPDGSRMLYRTILTAASPAAIAIDSAGAAYITGTSTSQDFPATASSLQPALLNPNGQAFIAKLDPSGEIQYATFVGGLAQTTAAAIVVDRSGRAIITGTVTGNTLLTTPGAIQGSTAANTNYIFALSPDGSKVSLSIRGFGGNALTLDADQNIYAAGAFDDIGDIARSHNPVPTTPGAFQSYPGGGVCLSTIILLPCSYQHIAKIDPTGTTLLLGTYVTGTHGATPTGIALDSANNIVIGGWTESPDYPVTPRAYQPLYLPLPVAVEMPHGHTSLPQVGFVTKLNPSASSVLWSTFFSGSTSLSGAMADQITNIALDPQGNVLIAGIAASHDLPGLWNAPVASRYGTLQRRFVGRISSNGETISASELVGAEVLGVSPASTFAARADGSVIAAQSMTAVKFSDPPRVHSITDVDNTRLVRIAPGQLLTLYGTKLSPLSADQTNGSYPSTFNGVTVTFNGVAAPILYAAGDQVNLQVPYELTSNEVTMHIESVNADPPVSESFILELVPRQPSLLVSWSNFAGPFVAPDACRAQYAYCLIPFALNEDGSINSADNPASNGSVVTIFLNGLGATSPKLATGAISTSQVTLDSPVNVPCCFQVASKVLGVETVAGGGTSIAQAHIRIAATGSTTLVPIAIDDAPGTDILFVPPPNLYTLRGFNVLSYTTP